MGNSSREVAARLLQADGRAKDRASAKAVQKLMDDTELAAWLRDRSAAELLSATTAGLAGMYSAPQIVHDGVVVQSAKPRQQFDDPTSYNSVPFMTGTNRDESKLFMARSPELVSRFLGVFVSAKDQAVYNHIAALQSDHWKARAVDTAAARIAQADGAPVYAYRFDWDEGANGFFVDYSNLLGAAHALEINFVLGDYDRATMVPGLYDGTDIAARDKLSDAMMGYWAQFAYTGNPGKGRNGNLPEWGAWGSDGGNFMVLDTDADGGIRMSADGVTFEDIKNRLARDETLPLQARCEMYAQLFFLLEGGHQHWDPAQYDTMGCKGMDPYNALRGF
jgi:para-nitrobenzyl esterase